MHLLCFLESPYLNRNVGLPLDFCREILVTNLVLGCAWSMLQRCVHHNGNTSTPTARPDGHGLFNYIDAKSFDAELQLDYFREIPVIISVLELEH